MCGQLGYSGYEKFDPVKIKTLMYINALERGLDATGVWSYLNNLDKSLTNGCSYATSKHFKLIPDTILMAHLRAATVGDKKNVNNTHPFHRGDYLLQHNGTLKNHEDLLHKYELNKKDYQVDSDIIAGCIAKCNDIKQVLSQIDGPAAIIIHDLNISNRLYVFRNVDRPLFRGKINNSMYMSSVSDALSLIQCEKIDEFKENNLYTIEDGRIIDTIKIKNDPYYKPVVKIDYSNKKLSDVIINCHLAIGCVLRGGSSFTLRQSGTDYKMVKGNYYFITDFINNRDYIAADIETGDIIQLHYGNFMNDDIIKDNDYVIALNDVYSNTVKDLQYIKMDKIYKCKDSFTTGRITIFDENEEHPLCTTSKRCFRKLTEKELEKHMQDVVIKKSMVPFVINNAEESAKVFQQQQFIESLDLKNAETVTDIIINDDNSLDDHMESEDFEKYSSNTTLVNLSFLRNHFRKINRFLHNLKMITETEKSSMAIKNRINTLIKINERASVEFTNNQIETNANN